MPAVLSAQAPFGTGDHERGRFAARRIVHFADPWCWWSWGLEPVLRRLKEVYGDYVEVVYRMGGVFDDIDEWRGQYGVDEESTVTWVRESVDITGNPLEADFYRKAGCITSYPSCLAFKAAEDQDPLKAEPPAARFPPPSSIVATP